MTVAIPLTKGYEALVDDEDAPAVFAAGKWTAVVTKWTVYAHRRPRRDGRCHTIYLHRFLTGWPYVDHRNGDGLDNRRSNLRAATHAENVRNRGPQSNNQTGYKGVSLDHRRGLYRAQIAVAGRAQFLGRFADPIEAARAYDAAARDKHGSFARLNFPENPR